MMSIASRERTVFAYLIPTIRYIFCRAAGFQDRGPIWCTQNIRWETCAAFEPCIQVPRLIAKYGRTG